MDINRFSQYEKTFSDIQKDIKSQDNSFSPQKHSKGVKIFAGINKGCYALSVVSKEKKLNLISTEFIEVQKRTVNAEDMAIFFILRDEQLLSIFISFAIDLENVLDKKDDATMLDIYNRYLFWQKMFKVEKNTVPESVIKGLINELYIIEKLMVPKYGDGEAIRGWIGSESERKDFAFSDLWYEAKAINYGKNSVKITSIEQLESNTEGILVVSDLEKTSVDNLNGIRLIDQVRHVNSLIDEENTRLDFLRKISNLGLSLDVISNPNHSANEYRYLFHLVRCYLVDSTFPKIRREKLPLAVGQVAYELLLAEIDDKLIEFK